MTNFDVAPTYDCCQVEKGPEDIAGALLAAGGAPLRALREVAAQHLGFLQSV